MIRVALTDAQRAEIQVRAHGPDITPRVRDRLEMMRLADAGWTIPRIARHLRCHEQTVRKYVKAFLAAGFAALPDHARSGRPPTVTGTHLDALVARLDAGDQTWTTPQLVAWLEAEQGVRVHPDHLSRLLHARRFGWHRIATSVAHNRRDPDAYATKVAELVDLKKRRGPAWSPRDCSLRSDARPPGECGRGRHPLCARRTAPALRHPAQSGRSL